MKRNTLTIIACFLLIISGSGHNYSGLVLNKTTGKPVEYVNIGIPGKNFGTVSDAIGHFKLSIDTTIFNDTLMFSCIGFEPYFAKVSDFLKTNPEAVFLNEKTYNLKEVDVRYREFREKVLGVTSANKKMAAGFAKNLLGYECGIFMRNKKHALIKKVRINISHCSYDSIFYRINIYQTLGKSKTKVSFENILQEPIYIKLPKECVKETIEVDISSKRIFVEGDFLVTLEHVKDLGEGGLYFCAGLSHKTFFRKTSQGTWNTVPIGVSINVIADVEK